MGKSSYTRQKSKKAVVLQQDKRSMNPRAFVIGLSILMLAFGLAYLITAQGRNDAQGISKLTPGTDQIRYPLSLFEDGKAHYFTFQASGSTIRYFLLKSADGIVRAAFDACDVCWQAGKGYYQDGDEMVCRNCGRRFASVRVNEVKGGCNPAPLNRRVSKEQLIIQVKDILEGHIYFKGA